MNTETLRALTRSDGPFASIYLDVSHDTEDAAARVGLTWREARDRLAELGAGEAMLAAVERAEQDGAPGVGKAGRALVVAGDEVLFDVVLPQPPPTTEVRYSPLPYVVPAVAQQHAQVPHVLVVVDKTGADLRAVDAAGTVHEPKPVEGEDHPVHKVRGGGWAHYAIQHRVEEHVEQTMAQVARAVERLAEEIRAQAVVLAGEVQARSSLAKAVSASMQDRVVQVESGGRADGVDESVFEAEVHALLERFEAEAHNAAIDRFRTAAGRDDGLLAQGLPASLAALREANAAAVLITDALPADRLLWTSADWAQVATGKQELLGLGMDELVERRADEALPAAAIAVGAELQVLGDELDLPDGVAVLLRHR